MPLKIHITKPFRVSLPVLQLSGWGCFISMPIHWFRGFYTGKNTLCTCCCLQYCMHQWYWCFRFFLKFFYRRCHLIWHLKQVGALLLFFLILWLAPRIKPFMTGLKQMPLPKRNKKKIWRQNYLFYVHRSVLISYLMCWIILFRWYVWKANILNPLFLNCLL